MRIEAAQAAERVAPPGAVVHLVAHRLAVLAVAGDGDADLDLASDDIAHRVGELALEAGLVERLVLA